VHFPAHVDYIFSQSARKLVLKRTLSSSFSAHDSLLIFCSILVRTKLEFASIMWNSITSTNAKQPKSVQQNFLNLCQNRFSTQDHVPYEDFPKPLKLHSLQERRLHLDVLLFISVYSYLKCCPSSWDITDARVILRNFRNSSLLTVSYKHSPSAACVSAANRCV